MVRVAYTPHLSVNHIHHYIEAHRENGTALHGKGAFGRWLKHGLHTVGHAITHSAIGQSLLSDGAKALGATFAGPEGAQFAGSLTHNLLQAHAHGAAPPSRPGRAPAPPGGSGGFHQPAPTSNPVAASSSVPAGDGESGFGLRRRRAPPKKKAAPKRKKAARRPF